MTFRSAALLLTALVLPLAACGSDKEQKVLSGLLATPPLSVSALSLPDASNGDAPFTFTAKPGTFLIVYFGYTQCPDACPTTLAEISQAKKLLGADGTKVQTIFISVDPERDTPQVLKAYMANFGPDFLGLRPADAQQLATVTKDFKIYYKKVPGDQPGTYSMDHTAATFVYDPQGKLRLYERYASGPEALASDVKQLLAA